MVVLQHAFGVGLVRRAYCAEHGERQRRDFLGFVCEVEAVVDHPQQENRLVDYAGGVAELEVREIVEALDGGDDRGCGEQQEQAARLADFEAADGRLDLRDQFDFARGDVEDCEVPVE